MDVSVFGAFSKALYLRMPDQRLILLHDSVFGQIPFGIGLRNFADGIRQELDVQVGTEGAFCDGVLTLDGCLTTIRLQERAEQEAAGGPPTAGERRRRSEIWCQRLATGHKGAILPLLGLEPMEENLFAKVAARPLEALGRALTAGDRDEIDGALLKLIGLGPGLTPSLDDFINGLQYTLQFAARNWKMVLPGTAELTAAVRVMANQRTNPFSACYLVSMAEGERFSLPERFLDGRHFMSDAAGEALLNMGASSGADMLCGILYALRLLEGET